MSALVFSYRVNSDGVCADPQTDVEIHDPEVIALDAVLSCLTGLDQAATTRVMDMTQMRLDAHFKGEA